MHRGQFKQEDSVYNKDEPTFKTGGEFYNFTGSSQVVPAWRVNGLLDMPEIKQRIAAREQLTAIEER